MYIYAYIYIYIWVDAKTIGYQMLSKLIQHNRHTSESMSEGTFPAHLLCLVAERM